MLKLAITLFSTAWLFVTLIFFSGRLVWDNGLLWLPPIMLSAAVMVGLMGWDQPEDRVALVLVAVCSFLSVLAYAVMYFFVFGLVGR